MYDAQMNQIEFGIEPDRLVSLSDTDKAAGFDTLIETARAIINEP